MGGHMLPGRERRRAARRSMRFTFAMIMTIPLAALIVVWVFAGTTLSDALAHGGQSLHGSAMVRITIAAVVGLVAVLLATLLMAWFARRIARDVASLGTTARLFADQQLSELVERLRRGDQLNVASDLPPPAPAKVTEISRVAAVLAGVQRATVAATASEIRLRSGVSQVFVSLARRSQSLLQRQLRLIDELEQKAPDPGTLADLFPLDHLTTRMRRHAEGLIILAGATPGRAWSSPVPVIDVIRGAVAEVEDYQRVTVATTTDEMMVGSVVADMIHLLAELIENGCLFSPSGARIEVRAERTGHGFAFEVEDRGLGITPDDLDAINERLGSPTDFDLANADQLGLFVVGKLAARHGVRVFLRPSPYGGTTAIVMMPASLMAPGTDAVTTTAKPTAAADRDMQLLLTGRARRPEPTVVPDPVTPDPVVSSPVVSSRVRSRSLASAASARPTVADSPGDVADGSAQPPQAPDAVLPRRSRQPRRTAAAGTHNGLPRRVRQASLSPHLRDSASADPTAPAAGDDLAGRTPEQARSLLASMQNGWERGRRDDLKSGRGDGPAVTGAGDPASQEGT
jgi:signal transduction histidine kinase